MLQSFTKLLGEYGKGCSAKTAPIMHVSCFGFGFLCHGFIHFSGSWDIERFWFLLFSVTLV